MLISRSIILFCILFLNAALGVELKPTLDGSDLLRFERYQEISIKAEAVVNSKAFKNAVLSKAFTSTKQSPQAILDSLFLAKELLLPQANGIWDWKVGFYYKKGTKVIGWTNQKVLTVWVNTAKFDYMEDGDVIANIVHEYTHKIGFDHSSASDYKSVPYALGYAARDIYNAKTYLEAPIPCPEPVQEMPKPQRKKSWFARLKSWFM